ncbi:MAG: DUF1315 family protein [Pseudomonadales bacterium]|nr:DUF1315 family protein [Pseudomonadales bacterium]
MNHEYKSLQDLLAMMDAETHANLKTAVELGRWGDGSKLSAEQLEYCLQAIIAYEAQNLPEHERVGFIDKSGLQREQCHEPPGSDQAVNLVWVESVNKTNDTCH